VRRAVKLGLHDGTVFTILKLTMQSIGALRAENAALCLISFIQTFKHSRHFDKLNRNTHQKNDEQNTKRT